MIDREKFGDAVYSILFPTGNIPIQLRSSLGAMDARLTEVHNLASGAKIKRGALRIMDPAESQELSRKIVALRDSQHPPITWRDIASELGGTISADAARCRYQDAKNYERRGATTRNPPIVEKPADVPAVPAVEPLQEVVPEPPESPPEPEAKPPKKQLDVKRARDLTPSERGHQNSPKIPHSEDGYIFTEKESGRSFKDITTTLRLRGIDCNFPDVQNRYYREKAKRKSAASEAAPKKATSPSPPGVEGAPSPTARAHPRGTPEEEAKPELKSISRPELDLKMWGLHKQGKTSDEISELLCSEGLYYEGRAVRRRLLAQGAQL